MGREVRRVPASWEHPQKENGDYQPLYDESWEEAVAEWKAGYAKWEADGARGGEFWEYDSPPDRDYYRPRWTDAERTHFQMYETVSEGTPISPPMESVEALARWLADNGASACAGDTATYEQWLRMCQVGWAPSFAVIDGVPQSGVEAIADLRKGD